MKGLNGKFATDTAYGGVKSLRGHVGCQLFPNKCGFKACYPLSKVNGNSVGDALTQFINSCGVPELLVFDGACANMSKYAEGRTPLEIITGETPDISEYVDFDFYDWVLYCSNVGLEEVEVARWLGVLHRVRRMTSYWLLPISGIPISATTM